MTCIELANINVCAEIELLKVKVPLICLGTEGVSLRVSTEYLPTVPPYASNTSAELH